MVFPEEINCLQHYKSLYLPHRVRANILFLLLIVFMYFVLNVFGYIFFFKGIFRQIFKVDFYIKLCVKGFPNFLKDGYDRPTKSMAMEVR